MEYSEQTARLVLTMSDQPGFLVQDNHILFANEAAGTLGIKQGEALARIVTFSTRLPASQTPQQTTCVLMGQHYSASVVQLEQSMLVLLRSKTFSPQTLAHAAAAIRSDAQRLEHSLEGLYDAVCSSDPALAKKNTALALKSLYGFMRTAESMDLLQSLRDRSYTLCPEYTDLVPFFEGLLDQARDLLYTRKIRLDADLPKPPARGWVDRWLLTTVFWHMAANAVAGGEGPILVRLRCEDKQSLRLSVRNTCRGASPISLPGLFARHEAPLLPGQGVSIPGFGLDLLRMAAELHGGAMLLTQPSETELEAVFSARIAAPTGAISTPPSYRADGAPRGLVGLAGVLDAEVYDPDGILG